MNEFCKWEGEKETWVKDLENSVLTKQIIKSVLFMNQSQL